MTAASYNRSGFARARLSFRKAARSGNHVSAVRTGSFATQNTVISARHGFSKIFTVFFNFHVSANADIIRRNSAFALISEHGGKRLVLSVFSVVKFAPVQAQSGLKQIGGDRR